MYLAFIIISLYLTKGSLKQIRTTCLGWLQYDLQLLLDLFLFAYFCADSSTEIVAGYAFYSSIDSTGYHGLAALSFDIRACMEILK